MFKQTPDTTLLIKRLENIKNGISINDTEDIDYQVEKLMKLDIGKLEQRIVKEVKNIIQLIEGKDFAEAMKLISELIQRFNTIAQWKDPIVEGLGLEIQVFVAEINLLENELTDIEKLIHDFEVRHTKELGELILKILTMRRKMAQQNAKSNPKDASVQEEYNEAQQEEKQYEGTYKEVIKNPIQELTEEQLTELKSKFRKICKLIHPDLVEKQFEKEASDLFIKAKRAKDENDLTTINEILEYIETGKPFSLRHETLTEKDKLIKESTRLRQLIKQLKKKIDTLKNNETYQTIISITDWNTYFQTTKAKLEAEANRLEILAK